MHQQWQTFKCRSQILPHVKGPELPFTSFEHLMPCQRNQRIILIKACHICLPITELALYVKHHNWKVESTVQSISFFAVEVQQDIFIHADHVRNWSSNKTHDKMTAKSAELIIILLYIIMVRLFIIGILATKGYLPESGRQVAGTFSDLQLFFFPRRKGFFYMQAHVRFLPRLTETTTLRQ